MKKRTESKPLTRRARFAEYVSRIAGDMRLRDWKLFIGEDVPSGDDTTADCYPIPGRKYATIRFSESFLRDTPEDQRHTIVHELIHCHLAQIQRVIEVKLDNDAIVRNQLEYAVDALADVIAPLLPLPPEDVKTSQ